MRPPPMLTTKDLSLKGLVRECAVGLALASGLPFPGPWLGQAGEPVARRSMMTGVGAAAELPVPEWCEA